MNQCASSTNINSMEINGISCSDLAQIKEHCVSFYKTLYSENEANMPLFNGLLVNRLSEDNAKVLEEEFTEEDVYSALSSLTGEKTLGPNVLQMEVIRMHGTS